VIVAILGMMLLAGCINPPSAGNNASPGQPYMGAPNASTNITPPQNQTPAQNVTGPVPLPENYTVSLGDDVSVIYALYVDGGLYDTNNATLANESGIYNPKKAYAPFNYRVMFGEGVIDGFIINTIGMRVNETRSFKVDPERGYGLYDEAKAAVVPRYYQRSVFETLPRSYFTERGLEVSNGTTYDSPYGPVFIHDYNDENVTIFYANIAIEGYEFTYNNIPQKVMNLTNKTAMIATIQYMLEEGKTYVLPDPATGQSTVFRVTGKNEQNITLDANHKLANKTLDFTVTLLDAVPAVKPG
jgi:FKBP-type peptidyl-prolyl cis-trans isomerase 2